MDQQFEVNMSIEAENPAIAKITEVCKRMADNKRQLSEYRNELKENLLEDPRYREAHDEVARLRGEMKLIKADMVQALPELTANIDELKEEVSADKEYLSSIVMNAIKNKVITPDQALEIGGGLALAPKISVSYKVQQMSLGL